MPESSKTVMGWVLVVAIISFILLIMVIIFGNLSGNVGLDKESTSFTNETITLNDTGETPSTATGRVNGALSSVVVTNATGGETVPASNYTVTGVVITANTGNYNGTSVNVSATVSYDSREQRDSDNIIFNYTNSATNIATQFPTVGTITGVAVLLIILIGLLIFAIRRMMGVTGSVSFSGSSRKSNFSGGSRKYS